MYRLPVASSPVEPVRSAVAQGSGAPSRFRRVASALALALVTGPATVWAQGLGTDDGVAGARAEAAREHRSGRDAAPAKRSGKANPVRARADRDRGYRIVVSLEELRLWVISQDDTLMSAPVAVGTGTTLSGLGRTWKFQTPTGVRTVVGKRTNPVWTPPDWMYVETAKENGLPVRRLVAGKPHKLSDGRKLVIRNGYVGLLSPSGQFKVVPTDEHVIYDEILFIPPVGTKNRRIEQELGKYALDTGDGYLLHGTPYEGTIGQKASHGCVRLRNEDVAWLHRYVPVGTRVYLY